MPVFSESSVCILSVRLTESHPTTLKPLACPALGIYEKKNSVQTKLSSIQWPPRTEQQPKTQQALCISPLSVRVSTSVYRATGWNSVEDLRFILMIKPAAGLLSPQEEEGGPVVHTAANKQTIQGKWLPGSEPSTLVSIHNDSRFCIFLRSLRSRDSRKHQRTQPNEGND